MNTLHALKYLNPHILICDRDPALAEAVRRTLALRRHSVRTCHSGPQCLELLKEHESEIVVLDADLLSGSDEGLIEWIASEDSLLPQMVVVAADAKSKQISDRLEPWVDVRIPRPESIDQLLPFVNQLETLIWWCKSPQHESSRREAKGRGLPNTGQAQPKC